MSTNIHNRVTVSPAKWPGKQLDIEPGDLARYMPGGLGLGGPIPLRPWDDPLTADPGQYYGHQPHQADPIRNSPTNVAAGGVIYFENYRSQDTLLAACRLLEMRIDDKKYAVFLHESPRPHQDRYLVQLRIVSLFALEYKFDALTEEERENWPEQPLSLGELLSAFVEDQEQVWGTGMSPQLSGVMGGDGDWAKEALAFGLFVENSYWNVYRFWSRAWLVTK